MKGKTLFVFISCLILGVSVTYPIFTKEEGESEFEEAPLQDHLSDDYKGDSNLGYELLDSGTVFHMWNSNDDYYFNRSKWSSVY